MKNNSTITLEYMKKGKSDKCPIIDMHGHFGPFGGSFMPGYPVEKMIKTIKRCGIKRIVCSPHAGLFGDPIKGNELIQDIIDQYPEYFLGYCIINPNFPDFIEKSLKTFSKSRGFIGFKFLPDYHLHPVTSYRYEKALKYADSEGLTVLVHTWGQSPFDSPKLIAELAPKYPDITFIMGHSGFGEWEESVNTAYKNNNVFLDLTAVYVAHDFSLQPRGSVGANLQSILSVNGVIEYMVKNCGSNKILFGTDLPWYSPLYAAGAILFSHINDEAKCNILYRNAEKILKKYLNNSYFTK
jgi:uncharacterized protein